MMQHTAPRDFTPGAGMPGDRRARSAARQAFMALKLNFLDALEDLPDAAWLLSQVIQAEEPVDLWLLRAPAFAALEGVEDEQRHRRQQLRRGLDSLFPDLEGPSGFMSL
jgi:hypothetical protein